MFTKQPIWTMLVMFILLETKSFAQQAPAHFNQPVLVAENGFARIKVSGNIDIVLVPSLPEEAGVRTGS